MAANKDREDIEKKIEKLLCALEPWLLSISESLSTGSRDAYRKAAAENIANIVSELNDG